MERTSLGIQGQRRLIGKVLLLFALSFPPSQVRQSHIQRAVPEPFHNRRHGQTLIGQSVCTGFPESVKLRFRYTRTLSDALQFAEKVSLHAANGVRKAGCGWSTTGG